MVSEPSFDPFQWIHHLEKSSPHFPEQLANLLDGEEFRSSIKYLRGDRLAMLVDDLDTVCPCTTFPYFPLTASVAP